GRLGEGGGEEFLYAIPCARIFKLAGGEQPPLHPLLDHPVHHLGVGGDVVGGEGARGSARGGGEAVGGHRFRPLFVLGPWTKRSKSMLSASRRSPWRAVSSAASIVSRISSSASRLLFMRVQWVAEPRCGARSGRCATQSTGPSPRLERIGLRLGDLGGVELDEVAEPGAVLLERLDERGEHVLPLLIEVGARDDGVLREIHDLLRGDDLPSALGATGEVSRE